MTASKDIGGTGRMISKNVGDLKEGDLAKLAVHSVMFHEIRSSELKIKPEEYNQIYNRMCNNLEVMK